MKNKKFVQVLGYLLLLSVTFIFFSKNYLYGYSIVNTKNNIYSEKSRIFYKLFNYYIIPEGIISVSSEDEFKKELENVADIEKIENTKSFLIGLLRIEEMRYRYYTLEFKSENDEDKRKAEEFLADYPKNTELLNDMVKQVEIRAKILEPKSNLLYLLNTPNMKLADSFFKKIKDSKAKQAEEKIKQNNNRVLKKTEEPDKSDESDNLSKLLSLTNTSITILTESFLTKNEDSKTKQVEEEKKEENDNKFLKKNKELNEYDKYLNKAEKNLKAAKEKYGQSKREEDKEEYSKAKLNFKRIWQDIYTLKKFESKIERGSEKELIQIYYRIKGNEKYSYLLPFFKEKAVKASIKEGYFNFLNILFTEHELDFSNSKIDGLPLLFYATEKDFRNSVEILIPLSASLNEELEDGRILLHVAAEKGNYSLVKRLIEDNKDNINKETIEGKTPLYYAIKNNRYDIAALLIKSGAKCDDEIKSETRNIPMRTILETGEIPSLSIKDDFFDENTALTEDEEKWKEAYEYIKYGNILKIYELIEKGVDFTEMYVKGESSLDIAIHYNQFYITRLLINLFDFTKVVNLKNGMTPLHHAIFHKNTNIFYLLTENGFDLNAIDSQGNTPLHYAVISRSYLLTDLLLIKEADSKKTNYKGQNPLHLAVLEKEPGIVCLLMYKTDINKQDHDGNTPLHLVAKNYDNKVFEMLCRRKKLFDCSIKNNENKTPHNISNIDYFENIDQTIKKDTIGDLKKKVYDIYIKRLEDGTVRINFKDRNTNKTDTYVFKSDTKEEELLEELKKLKSEKTKDSQVEEVIIKELAYIARKKDYLSLMKETMDLNRNDIDYTSFYLDLCKANSRNCIKLFANKEIDYRYGSFLSVATEKGNIQLARKALEAGADINNKYNNPLKNAVKFYQYEMAKFLIKNGAIVDEGVKKRTKDKQMLEILNMDVSFLKEFFNE